MGIVGVIDYLLHNPTLIIAAITLVLSAGGLTLSRVLSLLVSLPQAGFNGTTFDRFPPIFSVWRS
jgi:hypothetical protein